LWMWVVVVVSCGQGVVSGRVLSVQVVIDVMMRRATRKQRVC
jgi:hypothetical protein